MQVFKEGTIGPFHDPVTWYGINYAVRQSMSIHIGKICSKAFYGLYKIRQLRKFLNPEYTKTLVHAFVNSRPGPP